MHQFHRKIFIGFIVLLCIGLIPSAAAAENQWLPEVGTECNYQFFADYYWENGTRSVDSKFEMYRQGSLIFFTPTIASQVNPAYSTNWEKVENTASELYMVHSYSEKNATHLIRNSSISTTTTNYAYNQFNMTIVHISGSLGFEFTFSWFSPVIEIQKSAFHATSKTWKTFPDYINAGSTIDDKVDEDYIVWFTNGSQIMATYNGLNEINRTIIANGDGKVTSFQLSKALAITPLKSVTIRLELIEPEPTAPEFSLWDRIIDQDWLVVGCMLGVAFVIGFLVRRPGKK